MLRYAASTDAGARLLESVQETTGHGPCVQSLVDNAPVSVRDIAEDERWPDLAPVLVPSGIRSILGFPVRLAGSAIGSLNVYRATPYDWDESDHRALGAFDRVVEHLLIGAFAHERNEVIVKQLERALGARVDIERAVGVLMGAEGLEPAAAFERIRQAARAARRPVHDIAAQVVRNRRLPLSGL